MHRGNIIGEGETKLGAEFTKISTLDSFVTRKTIKGTPNDLCRAVPKRRNFKIKINSGPKGKCKIIKSNNAITKYFRPLDNSVGVPSIEEYSQKLKALDEIAKFSPLRSKPNQKSKLGIGPAILDC